MRTHVSSPHWRHTARPTLSLRQRGRCCSAASAAPLNSARLAPGRLPYQCAATSGSSVRALRRTWMHAVPPAGSSRRLLVLHVSRSWGAGPLIRSLIILQAGSAATTSLLLLGPWHALDTICSSATTKPQDATLCNSITRPVLPSTLPVIISTATPSPIPSPTPNRETKQRGTGAPSARPRRRHPVTPPVRTSRPRRPPSRPPPKTRGSRRGARRRRGGALRRPTGSLI